jgi:hypothetical protein
MEHGKTVEQCEQIARTMKEDSGGHEMAGCPMGQGGHYIYGGSGDDKVIIDKSLAGTHVEVRGGSGADTVIEGSSITDVLGLVLVGAVAILLIGWKVLRRG